MNETKGEYYLHGKEITEKQAEEYLIKNSKSDEIVVFVEGDDVGVYTINEAVESVSSLLKSLFSHKQPHSLKPSDTK